MSRIKVRATPDVVMECGCRFRVDENGKRIVPCTLHGRAAEMARLLDVIRNFYLAKPLADGTDYPFVEAIDGVLARTTGTEGRRDGQAES